METESREFSSKLKEIKSERGTMVLYIKAPYIGYIREDGDRFIPKLYIYNTDTGVQSIETLNRTNGFSDSELFVPDIAVNDDRITVINQEVRNSNGWVDAVKVWTYSCSSGSWSNVASDLCDAQFRKGVVRSS